jgi:excisionase family DNA binding protein
MSKNHGDAGPSQAPPRAIERNGLEWLGLRELTKYAAVSERTLRAWIHQAADPLPAVRAGGKLLVKRAAFDEWLERRRVQAVDIDAIVRELVTR